MTWACFTCDWKTAAHVPEMVDNEPMMSRAVGRMLKPSGHLVSVAGSRAEALEKLAEQTFDVTVQLALL